MEQNKNILGYMTEAYKKLLLEEEDGNAAKLVKDLIFKFCDKTIEDCKEKFSTLSTNNYQNLDNNVIFVLQLNIGMAKELKAFVENTIINGEQATARLNETRRN